MLVMWSPSFCSELSSCFSYQQFQVIGFLRVMGSIVLIGSLGTMVPTDERA